MADFNLAWAFTFGREVADENHGLSNDKDDDGGVTNFGYAQNYHPDIKVADLSLAQIKQRAEVEYWNDLRLSEIKDQQLANIIFDICYNSGADTAPKLLQRAINRCGGNVQVDGVLGSVTLSVANSLPAGWLSDRLRVERAKYFADCVDVDPDDLKFLKGWIWRACK
jgi:lysozyme family protein